MKEYTDDMHEITDGFFVDYMEFDDDTNNAYLYKEVDYQAYTASLQYVEYTGQLDGGDGAYIDVPDSILNMALKWAQKQGY
tara:strand:- start:77 stop:319 length:243 start_codon:yes stop_codon:yes gene_type:complete